MFRSRLDWLSFGAEHASMQALQIPLPRNPEPSTARFHLQAWNYPGIQIRTNPKEGCANRHTEYEFRGQAFEADPYLPILCFQRLEQAFCDPVPFRIDVCWDFINDSEGRDCGFVKMEDFIAKPVMANGRAIQQRDYDSHYKRGVQFTGFSMGRSDVRVRLYDKMEEQKKKLGSSYRNLGMTDWWRLEVQLRGDRLKTIWATREGGDDIEVWARKKAAMLIWQRLDCPKWVSDRLGEISQVPAMKVKKTEAVGRMLWRLETARRALVEVEMMTGCKQAALPGIIADIALLREMKLKGVHQ